MIAIRRAQERGHFDLGWLDTWHTFSFGEYRDPRHVRFGPLRVINEDRIASGGGFPMHGHRDMEIITYVIRGVLEHRDSLGNHGVVRPGEMQYMSAGTGVQHSEYNPSSSEPTHLLQIWIMPDARGHAPTYAQRPLPAVGENGLATIASPDGRDGSMAIRRNVCVLAGRLAAGQAVEHAIAPGRRAWLQLIEGRLDVNGQRLESGDGAGVTDEAGVAITASGGNAHFLLFDLD